MPHLPNPGFDDASGWVARHLGHLVCDRGADARPARRGGQRAADAALAALDVTGYAKRRSQVHPAHSRASTALSPYIRHGLITLAEAAAAVGGAPAADRRKFVDELWWQEYTRHLYDASVPATWRRSGGRQRSPLRPWPDAIRDDMGAWQSVATSSNRPAGS